MATTSEQHLTLTQNIICENFVVLTGSVFALVFLLITRKRKQVKNDSVVLSVEDIPGDKPLIPIKWIGNIFQFLPMSNTIGEIVRWCRKYPGICKLTLFNATFVIISSAEAVQQLFKSTDFGHNAKAPEVYDLMRPFLTNGLLVSKGKFWQGQRKILMKTQSFQALRSYMQMLNKHTIGFMRVLQARFQDGQPREINDLINVLFLRAICEMITGSDQQKESDLNRYHENFQIWKESLSIRIMKPWFLPKIMWRCHPLYKRADEAIRELDEFAKMNIRKCKQKAPPDSCNNANPEDSDENPKRLNMLEELIERGVDEKQIVDEFNTMIFGGHETGATTIQFFCLCMALNPKIQEACQKEIDDVFESPECVGQHITFEAAQGKLRFLDRCIQETLRIFPPVFVVVRKLESSFEVNVKGRTYHIPSGCNVAVPAVAIHRAREYYPDPMKFDPDRFLPEEVAKRPAHSFIPFSGGPRNCLGIRFAMLELKLVAAHLLRNFVITTNEKLDGVPLMPYATMTPARDYVFLLKKR